MRMTIHEFLLHEQRIASEKRAKQGILQSKDGETEPALESDLHDDILDHCRSRGWLAIHSRTDKRTTQAKGVCDIILVTPRKVCFVEVKRKPNKPTPEQLAFLAHVNKLGWPNAVVYNMAEFLEFMRGKE